MAADRTLVLAGEVLTMDPARPRAAAVVVRGERIEAVLDHAPPGAERVPCVLPGFTDAHVHFPSWALGRRELRLFDAESAAEVVRRVAATGGDGWLRGRGWREEGWPDAPSRALLDGAAGDRPVALRSHDGHSLWLSSAALSAAGGDLETPGGVVERDAHGAPTGVLREEAAWRFEAAHAAPERDEVLAAMAAAIPLLARRGVVAVHDKDGGRDAPALFEALGAIPVHVWQSVPVEHVDDPRADYVKAFMDGTLGSRTARLLDGSGVRITSTEGLAEVIRRAAQRRLPVAVHAIGDLANREALDAFEATSEVWRPLGLRHRIEHAQCVHPDDQPRFAALGVTASVQYTHAASDREIAARLWADRLGHAYPYRQLLDAGARLAAGSDAPVEELEPLAGVRAALEGGLTPEEALASFTRVPAWLEGREEDRGRIAPGLRADLVILDRSPLDDPERAKVKETLWGGRRLPD